MVAGRADHQFALQKMSQPLRILVQLFISVSLFIGTYYLLQQVEFVTQEDVRTFTEENEKRLGELILDVMRMEEGSLDNDSLQTVIEDFLIHLCESNDIESGQIQLVLLNSGEVNAFTLPGKYIVVYRGLIESSATAEELTGVPVSYTHLTLPTTSRV